MTAAVSPTSPSVAKPNVATRMAATYTLRLITQPTELESEHDAWTALSQQAAEPNVFYEPWFLGAAWNHLATGQERWQVAIIERTTATETEWCGFFPFVQRGGTLQLWQHEQCFLTTPLIRRGVVREVLETLFTELKSRRHLPGQMRWPLVGTTGPIDATLVDVCRQHLVSSFVHDTYNRALLTPHAEDASDETQQVFLHERFGGHHLRELRRQRRRLNEQGDLKLRQLQQANQLSLWTEWFLELESSGWKGRDGTAINCQPTTRKFLQEMLTSGFEAGAIDMYGLFASGEPIALKLNLHSGPGSFSYKIAFKEELAKFSPGVQLEIDHLMHFQKSGRAWMDSCANADHSMINRLWADRRTVQDITLSTGRPLNDLYLSALPLFRTCYRLGKRVGKSIVTFVKGRPTPIN